MNKPRTLSHIVKGISDPIFGKKSTMYSRIISDWTKIVGSDTAKYSVPLDLIFTKTKSAGKDATKKSKGSAILKLAVTSARAQDILMQKDRIIERVNQFMGYAALSDIQIIHQSHNVLKKSKLEEMGHTPVPKNTKPDPSVKAATNTIEDENLRDALNGLGSAITSRQSS